MGLILVLDNWGFLLPGQGSPATAQARQMPSSCAPPVCSLLHVEAERAADFFHRCLLPLHIILAPAAP